MNISKSPRRGHHTGTGAIAAAHIALALSICLLLTMSGSSWHMAQVQAQQECTSPIRDGNWTGTFLRQIKVESNDGLVVGYLDMEGSVDFTVGCSGTITHGKWRASDNLVNDQEAHAEYTLEVDAPAIGEEGKCVMLVDFTTNSSLVVIGETGNPHIDWSGTISLADTKCEGTEFVLNLMSDLLKGNTTETANFTWQDDGTSLAPKKLFLSGEQSWRDPVADSIIAGWSKTSKVVQDRTSWDVHFITPQSTPSPTTEKKDDPLVLSITPQFQGIFLENIPQVNNLYTANIDWNGEQPGTVQFQVDTGLPVNGAIAGNTASAPFAIHTLSAGMHTLSVRAISAKGKASPVKTLPIQVATVPAWAKPFNLTANPDGNSILYKSTASVLIPEQPAEAAAQVIFIVPYVAGGWGFKDMQFEVKLEASSLGTPRDTEVTSAGIGKYVVADTSLPYFVKPLPDSFVRTRIDAAQNTLVLDDGRVKVAEITPSFVKNITLDSAFPGLTGWLVTIRAINALAASFNVPPTFINVTLEGEGATIGVVQDKLALTGGQFRSTVNIQSSGIMSVSGGDFVMPIGGLAGRVTFDVAPQLAPVDCFLGGGEVLRPGT